MTYIYKGKTYSSMAHISREFGIPNSTLSKRIRQGYSIEDAIKGKSYNKYNAIEVEYKGKKYKSINSLALNLDIRSDYIYGRLKRGLTIDDSISEITELRKLNKLRDGSRMNDLKAQDNKIHVWNKTFNTLREIEKDYGLDSGSIVSHVGIEELIVESMEKKVNSDHKKYKSITKLSRHYGIQPDNVHQRLKKGWTLTRAVVTPVQERHGNKIVYKGKDYMSRSKLSLAYNIDSTYIYRVSKDLSVSWMEAFEAIRTFISSNNLDEMEGRPNIFGSRYEIIYDGVWFKDIEDLIKVLKVRPYGYQNKEIHERLNYLKLVLGEPKGICFNYRYEWSKAVSRLLQDVS